MRFIIYCFLFNFKLIKLSFKDKLKGLKEELKLEL
jgi:hypothetical protein